MSIKRANGSLVGAQDPAHNGFEIESSDTEVFAIPTRAIYVGAPGNLKVTMAGGAVLTFANVPAGLLPIEATKVWEVGTTASSLVGLI